MENQNLEFNESSTIIDTWALFSFFLNLEDGGYSEEELKKNYLSLKEIDLENILKSHPIKNQISFCKTIYNIRIKYAQDNHTDIINTNNFLDNIFKYIDNYIINIIYNADNHSFYNWWYHTQLISESVMWLIQHSWSEVINLFSSDYIWKSEKSSWKWFYQHKQLTHIWKINDIALLKDSLIHSKAQTVIQEYCRVNMVNNSHTENSEEKYDTILKNEIEQLLSFFNLPNSYVKLLKKNITPSTSLVWKTHVMIYQPIFSYKLRDIHTEFIPIDEISSNSSFFPFNININDIELLKSINWTELTLFIWKDLWIDFLNLTFQNQIYLLRYLSNLSIDDAENFKNILHNILTDQNKIAFLNTFLACSKTPEIWDKILELAEYNGSEKIFEAYAELINLQIEIDTEDIDSLAFLKSIISRWEKLLLDALQKAKSWEDLSIDKKYSSELVKSWAFVKALISKNKSWNVLEKNEFNEKCPYYNIETFYGWGNIIKSDDQLDLLSEENYISSEVFSKDDYKMIVNNLKEAYHEIDPEWLNILIANISEDLQNPDVTFYMMRDKNTKKLVSLCKSNKWVQQWELYLGTHYVEQDLRGDFGFWDYVLRLAIQENSNIDILTGSVAVNNPNLERHINYWWFSATEIVFDTDKNWNSSWELFKVDINKNYKYKSKNKYIYSDQEIKQLSWKPEKDNIIAYKCDSQSWYDQEFKEICKDKFNKWYAVTRLFYEKTWGQPDLNQTYIVFEKNEEL